jgi:hypothetical protein
MKMEVDACITSLIKGMKWNMQGRDIFAGHFILLMKGCVEKFLTRFRIDVITVKRGKLVCILVI